MSYDPLTAEEQMFLDSLREIVDFLPGMNTHTATAVALIDRLLAEIQRLQPQPVPAGELPENVEKAIDKLCLAEQAWGSHGVEVAETPAQRRDLQPIYGLRDALDAAILRFAAEHAAQAREKAIEECALICETLADAMTSEAQTDHAKLGAVYSLEPSSAALQLENAAEEIRALAQPKPAKEGTT